MQMTILWTRKLVVVCILTHNCTVVLCVGSPGDPGQEGDKGKRDYLTVICTVFSIAVFLSISFYSELVNS